MKHIKYLILGTGVAGSYAADKLVKLGQKSIMLVTKDVERPYDRPPLSKEFFKNEMPTSKVYYHPKSYYKKNNIILKTKTEIVKIEPQKKFVLTDKSGKIGFEKLLIALGSKARKIPGVEDKPKNLFHLRRFAEARRIKEAAKKAKSIVILGAGFIGLELAAALSEQGKKVSIISPGPHLWENFVNQELANIFEKIFCQHRVDFYFNDELDHFNNNPISEVVTKKGKVIPADMVIYAIGIILSNADLLKKSGFKFKDGLVVDKYLQTNFPDIFGAGDIINYPDPIFQVRRRVEHWGHAQYTGELAAENIAKKTSGAQKPYDLLTYVWSDLYNMHLEFAGYEKGYDEIKITGKPEKKHFTALYLKKGKLRAYFQVNGSQKEREELEKQIRA